MSGDGRPPGRRDDAADTDHVQGGGHRPAEAHQPPPPKNTTTMLVGHTDMVYGMATFHDRGKPRLVTGSHDNLVKVWDFLTGKELLDTKGPRRGRQLRRRGPERQ